MNNWYKKAQKVEVEAIINIDDGWMRRMPTTIGPTTNALDSACSVLDSYAGKIQAVEPLRKTLGAIADGGIKLTIDRSGYISVSINSPNPAVLEERKMEQTNSGDYAGPM